MEIENFTPFRFRDVADKLLVTNEVGDFQFFENGVLERYFKNELLPDEYRQFRDLSVLVEPGADWRIASLMRRARQPQITQREISYLIVIPTLRCDLSCSYCQVSRAPIDAKGFDWGPTELREFASFVDGIDGDSIKLEFQGGEPTLRPDLIAEMIKICESRFKKTEFVVCSNLTRITPEIEKLYEREDLVVSTSIDGPKSIMTANRTQNDKTSDQIIKNFQYLIKTYGPEKVSALPTITEASIENPEEVIDVYRQLGFESIFLRPVNYMGFARKRHGEISSGFDQWRSFYERSISHIIKLNEFQYFDEFYLGMLVRSIFVDATSGFVDFRSPSHFLRDYGVIDFNGGIYPSDEARMLSRIGHVDLSVGSMRDGIDEDKLSEINFNALHQVNPDCLHCAYMPYCGIDTVDDISRYNRIDKPKFETWFCNQQMMLFDLIFSKVIEKDRQWLDVFLKWIFRKTGELNGYEVFGD